MKLSRFAHLIERRILWHALRFTKLEVSDQQLAIDIVQALRNELRHIELTNKEHESTLLNLGFLVEEGSDDDLLAKVIEDLPEPQIQSLFLITTTQCNLMCDYCLYCTASSQSLRGSSRNMDPTTVIDSINLFAASVADNIKSDGYWQAITFYGGEPLTNMATMKSAILHIHKLQSEGALWDGTELVVNTNGVLIDDDFVALAAKEGMEIQVSLDGFQIVHDQHRRTKSGKGSFQEASSAIKKLVSSGVKVRPTITLTEENIPELLEFVTWMSEELGVTCYSSNLLMSGTGSIKSGYGTRAAIKMWEAHERNQKLRIIDPSFVEQLKQFQGPKIALPSCGANGRKITVFPDGKIHSCQALEASQVALIGDLLEIDFEGNWQLWKSRSRFSNQRCLRCPVLGACGGGCAAGAYHINKDINGQDPNHCQWIKSLFVKWICAN
jgi:radical SAM protein with 4Fe4S-binding SPASM domain